MWAFKNVVVWLRRAALPHDLRSQPAFCHSLYKGIFLPCALDSIASAVAETALKTGMMSKPSVNPQS